MEHFQVDPVEYHKIFKGFLGDKMNPSMKKNTIHKLTSLTENQYAELATDIYDEVKRRTMTLEEKIPFLHVRTEYHPKRNQARQKLATLQDARFKELVFDVIIELEHRFPKLTGQRDVLKEEDELLSVTNDYIIPEQAFKDANSSIPKQRKESNSQPNNESLKNSSLTTSIQKNVVSLPTQVQTMELKKSTFSIKFAGLRMDSVITDIDSLYSEIKDKTALLQELIDELQKLNKELESKQRPSQIVQQHIVDGYRKEIDELNIKLIDARDNFQNGKNQIVGLSKHVSKLQADLKAHQKRILTIKNNIEQCGGDFGKLEQIQGKEAVDTMEQYKTLLKCSACNLNFKSHIITRCWHMFCENCIQSRIETRQRKCPTCSERFDVIEVKPIYFQ